MESLYNIQTIMYQFTDVVSLLQMESLYNQVKFA